MHKLDVASASSDHPGLHTKVEQAARASQHSSLSAPDASHVSPAHSAAAALASATQPSAHVIVEQAARATQLG